MNRSHQTAARFREVILDGTFIANTNYKDQLRDLDWKTATQKWGSLNTIALLAQHIHYYVKGVLNVLKGGSLDTKDQYSFDFPPLQSQSEWDSFLSEFWQHANEFVALVEQLPEEKLQQVFVEEKYGLYQRNLDGMIEHCYYHLGQIVLLKKIIAAGNPAV